LRASSILPTNFLVILLVGSFLAVWPLLSVASNDLSAALADFGKGTAIGLFNAAGAIASAAGAIIGGAVAVRFGYPSVGLFAAVGIAAALTFVFHLWRLEKAATAPAAMDLPLRRSF
jgi:predicted MFS family arabinose efflux permease